MKVAVLIDGGFFIKRAKTLITGFQYDAEKTAKLIWSYAMRHVEHDGSQDTLYRLFYYDCPPLDKKAHYPISKKVVDFKKSNQFKFRTELFQALRSTRKVALRLGYLSKQNQWSLKAETLSKLLKNNKKWNELTDNDFTFSIRQKAVDSRIAVDVDKHQVERIILVAGDADFVPASKLARREGIDFILDPLHNPIDKSLHEHIDGCHSKGLKSASRKS